MISKNSKMFDFHRLIPNLLDKISFKRSGKYVALSNLSICYTWKNIKMSYTKNKFGILAPTCNNKFELPDGSYSVSDIQDYFKKHKIPIDNPPIRIYINKTENRVTFKIKTAYYLKLLTPEIKNYVEALEIR